MYCPYVLSLKHPALRVSVPRWWVLVLQDLYDEIEKQRVSCEKIINSKDKLIGDIRGELKKKDDEYVKILKRQAEDVSLLLQYMSQQYIDMQTGYREELDEVEQAYLQVRPKPLTLSLKP
jgi:dynein regulatry complex protein 1